MQLQRLLFVMIFWASLAQAGLAKSFPLNMIFTVYPLELVSNARVLYAGPPNPRLLEEIYLIAPQAKVDFAPDGDEYDNIFFLIAPESQPILSWICHLKRGGRGVVVALPIFLEDPFPFSDYFGLLEGMQMDILDSTICRFPCVPLEPAHNFCKWIEDSIIIPFGMSPSEELIDHCIKLAATNEMIDWVSPGGPYFFINEVQIICFKRL